MPPKKTFIIAEAGVNHNGSLDLAKQLVDRAVDAGADAVKFQSFKSSKLVTRSASKADYQSKAIGEAGSQLEMLQKLELSEEGHQILIEHCRARGIEFMSTPFDDESLEYLVSRTPIQRLKLSSGDLTNAPFLLKAARSGKPLILSTGMATMEDIELALGAVAIGLSSSGPARPGREGFLAALRDPCVQPLLAERVTVLHCTTEYPAPLAEVNLRAMKTIGERFGVPVGYSDHTQGITVPVAAVALGACLIEKHFTLDRSMPGPDHKASLEPGELKAMVQAIREVELALGSTEKAPTPSEARNAKVGRRSLVALEPIRKGEPLTEAKLGVKRPGSGVSPFSYWEYLGKPANRDYSADELIDSF